MYTYTLRTTGEAVLVTHVACACLERLLLDQVGDSRPWAVAVHQLCCDVVWAAAGQRPRDVAEVTTLGQFFDGLAQLSNKTEAIVKWWTLALSSAI